MGTVSSGSMRSSADCHCSADISLHRGITTASVVYVQHSFADTIYLFIVVFAAEVAHLHRSMRRRAFVCCGEDVVRASKKCQRAWVKNKRHSPLLYVY